jgi:hypothetical protein
VATAMSRRSAASSAAQQPQKARGCLRETVAEQLRPPGRWSAALLGAPDVRFLVPNRFEYGYGLTPESVAVATREVPDLLITIDNGISSLEGGAGGYLAMWVRNACAHPATLGSFHAGIPSLGPFPGAGGIQGGDR